MEPTGDDEEHFYFSNGTSNEVKELSGAFFFYNASRIPKHETTNWT